MTTLEEILQESFLQKDTLPNTLKELFSKVRNLYSTLQAFSKKGCLYQAYVRCGTKGCHCARLSSKGHGPYWYMKSEGKTIYLGIQLPAEFIKHRFYVIELDQLIQDYAQIEIASNELRHLIKEFVLKADPILSNYQEDEES